MLDELGTELGVVEGFYGPLWDWQDRRQLIDRLTPVGYRFYLYAPKADRYLRRDWQTLHPREELDNLQAFADYCRCSGVRFGVGLSPYEVFNDFDDRARDALKTKIQVLDAIGTEELAILFDDMRSSIPDLAGVQTEIVHWIAGQTKARTVSICPTYYSSDPVLDRVFGPRPDGYLEQLGRQLDPEIRVFWTGEEVCSREISPGHLREVGDQLQRKPLLWDNYPVNDGERMSRHLHLRAFTGRPAANAGLLCGHAINPALQPVLTQIPALTLASSYERGEQYCYGAAFKEAARLVLGERLAEQVTRDLLLLEDRGLSRISAETLERLKQSYRSFDHPGAQEIVRWLCGEYQVSQEQVETQ